MNISDFPFSTFSRNNYIFYKDLDVINKETVTKHLKIAGEIFKWFNITDFLIDEIHEKKSIYKRGKYKPVDQTTDYYYKKFLFKGKKRITSCDIFPSAFKCYLEDVMYTELTIKNFDFTSIYYSHSQKPQELKYDDFDKNEWSLSEGLQMTQNDLYIMEKYKEQFLDFVERCLNMLKFFENDKKHSYRYEEIKKERNRLLKIMIMNP